MCYADGSPQKQKVVCKASSSWRLFDCGGNDYFSIAPKAGSYLTHHWNSASSQFLIRSRRTTLPTAAVAPKVTITTVDPTHLRLSWQLTKKPTSKVTSYLVWGVKANGNLSITLSAKTTSLVVKVTPNEGRSFQVAAVNAAGVGNRSHSTYGETGTPPKLAHVEWTDSGDGTGQVSWSDTSSSDSVTKYAVTVNGTLPDGRDLQKVLDPTSSLYGDFSPTWLSGIATASVIKVWARNAFGTVSVTVSHPPYTPPPSAQPSDPVPSYPAPSVYPSASTNA
jgi:hypothetical protein